VLEFPQGVIDHITLQYGQQCRCIDFPRVLCTPVNHHHRREPRHSAWQYPDDRDYGYQYGTGLDHGYRYHFDGHGSDCSRPYDFCAAAGLFAYVHHSPRAAVFRHSHGYDTGLCIMPHEY